ncbi:class I SAM-dependent methyltransferase [Pontibacter roseus]|uniref:class I SAM-dependent methyltransferase n=1 Tax=Pontibacter roseus TaxID=336989 RepID=UPI00035CA1D0|nr:class I SAM-dependent methyltransferase [Pontibacter roseus]
MDPLELGKKYDKIAAWWQDQHIDSAYGVAQVERAIRYTQQKRSALDVGCGSGGRIIRKLLEAGFRVTGIDVSAEMLKLAREQHPEVTFQHDDICTWETETKYDLIIAWDSIFHLPLSSQASVVAKLCSLLQQNGILLYTFGNGYGEHDSEWHNDTFHYSTIGINQNLKLLLENDCQCLHLELDQHPDEKHVYVIARKLGEFQV